MLSRTACCALAVVCLAAETRADDRAAWTKVAESTETKAWTLTGGSNSKKLLVDTVHGSIRVRGVPGDQVQLTLKKSYRAESDEALAEAKRDVVLEDSRQGNYLRLYVNGPWRNGDNNTNYRGRHYYGYEATFDFELTVPRDADLILRNVTNGSIEVHDVSSVWDIRSVNQSVVLDNVGGSGSAHTVNGNLRVSFGSNPNGPSTFKTLNGGVDVYFQPDLNADLRFKTFNGSIFTDFDVAQLPAQDQTAVNRKDGRWSFKLDRVQSGRVGKGGPALHFESFNGSVRVHKEKGKTK